MHSTEDGEATGGQDGRAEAARPRGDVGEPEDAVAAAPVPDADADEATDTGSDPAGGPTLTVAAVAGRLGVAPATLRTWDRRYGLGPSEHTAGAHRRYSAADLARLMTMRSLTLDGVPPSDAARVARESTPAPTATVPDTAAVRHLTAVPDMAGAPAGPGIGDLPDQRPAPRRDQPATPTAVIDAALRADAAEVDRLLALPAEADLVRWWSDLVGPARAGIAARTVLARPGDEPDALVVAAALAVLRSRNGHVPTHPSRRRIVLMLAAPGEPRPLSLHVLAGALADSGVDARVVAGPTGRHRLLEIATMTTPSAVVLSSELTAPDLGLVAALAEQQPDLPVFVMVPDEAAGSVPLGRQVHRVRTVPGLVHEVLAVCT
jgi:DNA-binding transcriptional MerR regulator